MRTAIVSGCYLIADRIEHFQKLETIALLVSLFVFAFWDIVIERMRYSN